jgi:hypothetical protein
MLPENDELGMPPPTVFQPDHSKRNRLIAVAIVVLLLAGAAIWWFVLRDKPAKPAAQNTSQQPTATNKNVAKHNIYVASANRADDTTDIQVLDTNTGQASTVSSRKSYLASVELPNGTLRTLDNVATNDDDGTNHSSIVLQDGNNKAKTIFSEVTSNKANTVSKTLWPSVMNADGTKVYFYESDNMANTARVATIDEKGVITDLITYKSTDGKTGLGQFKGTITPGYVSKDEKTIYFNVHSCLNCDGPSYADVVGYDVTTKTWQQYFTDPAFATDKAEGYWAKLSDDLFVVRSDAINSNFILPSYETAVTKAKSALYLFDTRTNKATQVFASDATHPAGIPLNLSADGKTFYYYTDKMVKDDALSDPDNAKEGHTFHYATDEIRSYDIAGAKTASLNFGLDATKVQPTFLTSNGTSYLFGTSGRSSLTSEVSSEPLIVYSAPLATPGKKKTVISTPATDLYSLTYLGYTGKQ